ncbi:MAG: ornithine carbamoyltransferase [Planctomycetota bacterium]
MSEKSLRHLVNVTDLNNDEIERVYRAAAETKARVARGIHSDAFAGRVLGMIFEKPSMRTRMSFQAAMIQAGGQAMDIRGGEIGLGKRESVKDVANVMSRYVDAIMIRTFAHRNVELLARHAGVPVINGLSDAAHPCQALSDVFTVREKLCPSAEGLTELAGVTLAFVGDGNNVARSLAMLCAKLGMTFVLSAPEGHELDDAFLRKVAEHVGEEPAIRQVRDPHEAVRDARIIYTDVWASMGQEAEAEARRTTFRPYQVNGDLLAAAPADALVMHCLPAHRGEEITDDVMDGERSIAYDQAENRLHVQKALLFFLLGVEAT